MTLEQALNNIQQALDSIQANKQVHKALEECMDIVKAKLYEPKEVENAKEA